MKILNKNIIILIATSSILFSYGLTLESSNIKGQLSINQVLNGFGCKGKNISPELKWKNIPKNTKSFAITMHDKDAPTGSGWWHWVVFDINRRVRSISANASALNKLPKNSIESITDFGKSGFGGACPPKGDKPHQYIITLYALNSIKLGLNKKSSPALVGFKLNKHVIAKSSIIAYYQR